MRKRSRGHFRPRPHQHGGQAPTAAPRQFDSPEQEYQAIRQALRNRCTVIEQLVLRRFHGLHPWRCTGQEVAVADQQAIDLVFEQEAPGGGKIVLVDLTIPHLGKGQKFTLEHKANLFMQQRGINPGRVKKALLLVKRQGDPIRISESRLRCPIISVTVPELLSGLAAAVEPIQQAARGPQAITNQVIDLLLDALVRDSLATMRKRWNKYVRKGLWRWIEREISDPNQHFFLILLSCIYQGNTGDLLSQKFRAVEDYTRDPAKVVDVLFSPENNLSSQLVNDRERHQRAVVKFLGCFEQTGPFEYLRGIFFKEFRTGAEGLVARRHVYEAMKVLMRRCGFDGEKEILYPLEILVELGIFQNFLTGDFTELRVENATKKLMNLVPNFTWTPEQIYKLRDQLARTLGFEPIDFNLNAYLPQAFSRDLQDRVQQGARAAAALGRSQAVARPPAVAAAVVAGGPAQPDLPLAVDEAAVAAGAPNDVAPTPTGGEQVNTMYVTDPAVMTTGHEMPVAEVDIPGIDIMELAETREAHPARRQPAPPAAIGMGASAPTPGPAAEADFPDIIPPEMLAQIHRGPAGRARPAAGGGDWAGNDPPMPVRPEAPAPSASPVRPAVDAARAAITADDLNLHIAEETPFGDNIDVPDPEVVRFGVAMMQVAPEGADDAAALEESVEDHPYDHIQPPPPDVLAARQAARDPARRNNNRQRRRPVGDVNGNVASARQRTGGGQGTQRRRTAGNKGGNARGGKRHGPRQRPPAP